MRAGRVTMHLPRRPVMSSYPKSQCAGEMKSGQLPAGGWPGARAGWLAARVHPVSLRFMHDACMHDLI